MHAGSVITPWQLQPALPADRLLASADSGITALFHRLDCAPDWFRRHAVPVVQGWAANSFLLADLPSTEQVFALEHWLTCAAAAAAACPGASPAQRLRAGHRTAMDLWWQRCCQIRLCDAHDQTWPGAQGSIRHWQRSTPAPHRLWCRHGGLDQLRAGQVDPWQRAAAELVQRQLWQPGQSCGRWWQADGGWCLLWPLGGRDLLDTAAVRALDPGTSETAALTAVLAGLRHWGHLQAGPPEPVQQTRADGRVVGAVRARACLFGACIC